MSSGYINLGPMYPQSWRAPVATFSALPSVGNSIGDVIVTQDSGNLYEWNGTTWNLVTGGGGGGGVTTLNGFTGGVTIDAGTNITVTSTGNTITIAATSDYKVAEYTLSPTDIANGYVTLPSTPAILADTILTVIGGPMQEYGVDFIVSGSQLTWASYTLQGILVSGDVLIVQYT